jgi:hypothetical protein
MILAHGALWMCFNDQPNEEIINHVDGVGMAKRTFR